MSLNLIESPKIINRFSPFEYSEPEITLAFSSKKTDLAPSKEIYGFKYLLGFYLDTIENECYSYIYYNYIIIIWENK